MDFSSYMLGWQHGAAENINSGEGGTGGKSKVIRFYSTGEELWERPYFMLGEDAIYFKISNDTLTVDELVGGIVGSAYYGNDIRTDSLLCYYLKKDLSELPETEFCLFIGDGTDAGIPGATAAADVDGKYIVISLTKEAAALVKQNLGVEASEGLWVLGEWMINAENNAEFVLAYNAKESSEEEWMGDGNTHLWISLAEGRTSPMLGACPQGTVTVDWGDGTEPDVLTGTSTGTVVWTPTHEYGKAGDYVITLTVDGKVSLTGTTGAGKCTYLLAFSPNADIRNREYAGAIKKIEVGHSVITGLYAFNFCTGLRSIKLSDSETRVANYAIQNCTSLQSIVIPDNVTSIGTSAFYSCTSLQSVVIPNSVTSIESSVFSNCTSLQSVVIPNSVTSIESSVFTSCASLQSIVIPNGVTSMGSSAFSSCRGLQSVVIPGGVTSISSLAFNGCSSMLYYDFSKHAAVPALASTNAFTGIPSACEIRVPAALAEEWKAATNWSTYADYIVGV